MGRVQRVMDDAMTVGQLLKVLDGLDKDTPVLFACDYGDRCHTMQALKVKSANTFDSDVLHESAYSNSGVSFNEDDFRELDDGEEERVVVVLTQDW